MWNVATHRPHAVRNRTPRSPVPSGRPSGAPGAPEPHRSEFLASQLAWLFFERGCVDRPGQKRVEQTIFHVGNLAGSFAQLRPLPLVPNSQIAHRLLQRATVPETELWIADAKRIELRQDRLFQIRGAPSPKDTDGSPRRTPGTSSSLPVALVQECVTLLELARRRTLIQDDRHAELTSKLEEISKMLSGLTNFTEHRKACPGQLVVLNKSLLSETPPLRQRSA